jgi:hypothetical protein
MFVQIVFAKESRADVLVEFGCIENICSLDEGKFFNDFWRPDIEPDPQSRIEYFRKSENTDNISPVVIKSV